MIQCEENTLYQECRRRGITTESHASDLYIRATAETLELLCYYKQRATLFQDPDGESWFDVPFAYLPFWEKVQAKAWITPPE